jgi:hypothetical protein
MPPPSDSPNVVSSCFLALRSLSPIPSSLSFDACAAATRTSPSCSLSAATPAHLSCPISAAPDAPTHTFAVGFPDLHQPPPPARFGAPSPRPLLPRAPAPPCSLASTRTCAGRPVPRPLWGYQWGFGEDGPDNRGLLVSAPWEKAKGYMGSCLLGRIYYIWASSLARKRKLHRTFPALHSDFQDPSDGVGS